jgi:hypothetical protein
MFAITGPMLAVVRLVLAFVKLEHRVRCSDPDVTRLSTHVVNLAVVIAQHAFAVMSFAAAVIAYMPAIARVMLAVVRLAPCIVKLKQWVRGHNIAVTNLMTHVVSFMHLATKLTPRVVSLAIVAISFAIAIA